MKKSNETAFYQDDKGEIKYNKFCEKCINPCKQSFKAELVTCPNFRGKPNKERKQTN